MKQIYIEDHREHRFVVNEANRPGPLANILGSVLSMLPGFHNRQSSTTPNQSESDEQVPATPEASTIETASTINNNSAVNNNGNTENECNTIHNNTNEASIKNEVFLNTRNIAVQRDDNSDTADFHVNQGKQDDAQIMKVTHPCRNHVENTSCT